MNIAVNKYDRRRGTVLLVVMGMMAIGTLAVGSILSSALGKMRLADKQLSMEQAFYIAQAGAERAATRLADGRTYGNSTLNGDFGAGSYVTEIEYTSLLGGEFDVEIVSTGTVKGQSRTITMHGVRRASWARYALWYERSDPSVLWITPGEKFAGPVYSKPQFNFHDKDLASKGQTEFMNRASSGAKTANYKTSKVKPIFHRGLALSAPTETMASVSFSALLTTAEQGGMVLYGPTTIDLDGNEMLITNTDAGWTNKRKPIPANGVLYVKTIPRSGRTAERKGDVEISAPQGLNGRLTIVAENDVEIMDHIKYASDPRYNPNSDDALGLIAHRSVVVETTAPNDVNIFAHMIAVNGGFGVKNHDQGKSRGMLNVYGGIVNKTRNAVGLVGSSGYDKYYIFDIRFTTDPPPNYPKLVDQLEWTEWEG
ncbi:MAG: hypothetical protein WC340_09405 [Kiritimatiellia bacterium]